MKKEIIKMCLNCNMSFTKTKYPAGGVESTSEFNKRKFCSHNCYSQ